MADLFFEVETKEGEVSFREGLIFLQAGIEVPELGRGRHLDRQFGPQGREVIRFEKEAPQRIEIGANCGDRLCPVQRERVKTQGDGKAIEQRDVGPIEVATAKFRMQGLDKLHPHV